MSKAKKIKAQQQLHTVTKKVHSKKQIQRAAQQMHVQNGMLTGLLKEIEVWLGEDMLAEFEKWRANPTKEKTLSELMENK